MDTTTMIVGGALALLLANFIIRLIYTITTNVINGRKFHLALEKEFNKLRLSKMLSALGINKTAYIYQTKVKDIQQQMKSCSSCDNTDDCDEELSTSNVDISRLNFCKNEAALKEIKQDQSTRNI